MKRFFGVLLVLLVLGVVGCAQIDSSKVKENVPPTYDDYSSVFASMTGTAGCSVVKVIGNPGSAKFVMATAMSTANAWDLVYCEANFPLSEDGLIASTEPYERNNWDGNNNVVALGVMKGADWDSKYMLDGWYILSADGSAYQRSGGDAFQVAIPNVSDNNRVIKWILDFNKKAVAVKVE